jgi:hypothetical protein
VQDAALHDNVAPRSSFHSQQFGMHLCLKWLPLSLQCDPLLDFSLNACWRHSVLWSCILLLLLQLQFSKS